MAKQLNVNLAFTADTSQALRNLQELKQNLSQIASMDVSNANISAELKTAASSAQALQMHLSNAFNVKTGNLDLSKLDASLKRSGASLSTLSNNLLGAGISGEKAFLQIQSSIASANTQLVKANGLVANFMTTLKNTARWQISSSILHGFMGAVQSAYGYAQDLNESLNNIRIVTGANTEEMSRFAAEANKTAKALSTTTTKYTNASLIYFQQGLSEEEVKQRTDITVKMANAAGASVEEVSNQLTAVWNNFAKSGEDLEHYADVMTALGAATASSTDEIAGGLEKFAAVADTIGLSFEYAASALATITSNTRQSEEVVGTALKTIFARIQGLNLGETLDDGTTLNKYSEALQKVGISIFEQNGEIKKMDSILDEMANKWQTLAKDQQIALAQTVAGVRQYTQLVSLMDNWNSGDSDSMMANLQTSADAKGSLQAQSDIYSESWEAASDRVRASLESIYKELVPDDMFIGLLKGLEKVLNMVEALVNAFGGLEGILMLVSSVVLTKFTANIGQGIQTGIDKVKNLSNTFKELGSYVKNTVSAAGQGIAGATQATFQSKQKDDNGTYKNTGGFEKLAQSAAQAQTSVRGVTAELERQQALSLNQASQTERTTKAFQSQVQTLKETTALTKTVKDNAKLFTEDTSKQLLNEIEQVRVLGEKKALLIEQSEILKEQNRNLMDDVAEDLYADAPEASGFKLTGDSVNDQLSDTLVNNLQSLGKMSGLTNGIVIGVQKATKEMTLFNTTTKTVNTDFSNLEALITTSVSQVTEMSSITSQLKDINLDDTFGNAADKAAAMQAALNKTTGISDNLRKRLQSAINALKSGDVRQFQTLLNRSNAEAKNLAKALGVSEDAIKRATQAGQKQASNIKQQTNAQNEYNNALNQTNQNIQTALANAAKIGPVIAQGLSQFQSVAMGISSVANSITTLTDSSASFTSKLTATAMGLTMGFRAFMTVIQGVNSVLTAMNGTQAVSNALAGAQVVLTGQMTAAKAKETIGIIAQQAAEKGLNATQVASMLTEQLGIGTKKAAALARLLVAGAAKTEAGALQGATAAQVADTVATNAGTAANIAYAASQWLAYWPLLLIVAALAIIVGYIVAANKAEQARIKNNKRMAEASKENAKAMQEEANANKELIQSYNDALATFNETGEKKEELVKAALEVATAYGLEGAAVDALAGHYESLTKKIQAKRKEELKALKNSKDKAAQDGAKVFADNSEGYISGSKYQSTFDIGWTSGDEKVAFETLNQGDYKYLTANGTGSVSVSVNKDNPMEMYGYFQELEAWISAQQQLAEEKGIDITASEIYQDAVAELEAGKDYYAELKDYFQEHSEIQAEMATYDTTFVSDGKRKTMDDIETLEEYIAFEKEFVKNYATSMGFAPDTKQWEEAEQYAKNYLTTFEDLNQMQLEARGFESLINNEDYDKIKQYYDSLNDAQKEVFWTAGIDENTSIAEVESYMDYAQSYIDAHGLFATIAIKDKAITAFEQGNYEELKTIFEGEDSPYDMEWMDFLALDFQEKQRYLESAYINYNTILQQNAQALEDNAKAVEDAQKAYDDANAAVETASQIWSDASQNVADHSKKIEQTRTEFGYDTTGYAWHTPITSGQYTVTDELSGDEEDQVFNAYKMFEDINLIDYLEKDNELVQQWSQYMDFVRRQQTANESDDMDDDFAVEEEFNAWVASSGFFDNIAQMVIGTGKYEGQEYEVTSRVWNALDVVQSQGEYGNHITEIDHQNAAQYFLDALMYQMDQEHIGLQRTEEEKHGEYDTATGVASDKEGALNELQDTRQEQLLVEKSLTEAAKEQDFLNSVNDLGFDIEVVDDYADALYNATDAMYKTEESAETMQETTRNLALAHLRMEKGFSDLVENWEEYDDILGDTTSSLKDVSKIMPEVNTMLQNMLDLSDEEFALLPDDFAKENWGLIQDVYNQVDGAYEALRKKVTDEIILNIGLNEESLSTVQGAVTSFLNNVELDDLEINSTLDSTGFSDGLQELLDSGAVTVDQMNDILSGIGYEPNIEYETIEIESQDLTNQTGNIQVSDVNGNIRNVPVESIMEVNGKQYIKVPKIGGSKFKGGGSGVADAKVDTGSGGGGSKPKKAEPTKKSDVVKRYKEVEDKLDDIREEADRVRDSLDRLYGAEHEAAIQRLLELEQQEIDLLKEKEQEARNYLQEDLIELKKVSAEVDVEFKFDDNNNIANYEEEMTELYEELAEIQRKAGDEWDENEQKEIDALNEKIKKLEEAMAAYEETRELLEDINAELDAFKGKPALPLITSDTLDIYWEINDALDDIDEQIKDLERKAEGLSGEEKLKVLEEINRLEQERVTILQQQVEANQKDIEEKRAALDELARLNGLQFEYDEETGNITNYLEQMGILQAQLDELHAKKAADGLSPAEEEAMNSIIAKMEELADLAGDYRDAVEESEDILNEIEDTLSGIVADPFVRSDFVDIFKETNDQLDDIDRKISKLQNEADKLTGEARRKKLNEIVTLERKRVEILEHQALIAKTEMEDRKRAMEEIAARQELMFEYDENQNITNYQEQLDVLIDKYEKAYNEALGDDGLIDATEQAILDSISDDIDHLEEFIQAYCDAVDQLEDIEDEREELANGGYVDMSQLDDIADELHDINQSLDDLQELLDDSNRAADRLYGAARIKQMEKNASLLQQEIDLLQQKKTAQDDIIAKEKQQLDEKTGGYIKYDEYGRITNYDSYINAREDQIREYEAALQEGGLSETEATLLQDEIDLLNEQIAAMEDYEQALEEKENIQNQIEDAYYEWQDLNAEKLQYKLELQLNVNDRELAKIERAIKRLDGNFYSRAEALALMVGGGMNGDSKLGNYNKQLADLEAHYQEVKRQYEAGEISQAKYVEMTKQLQAEIESTADAMAALQDQMDSYYKDTLAQARQELNFHISQLTHLTGILNHFKNTLTALGKSKDYEMMGTVLEGQVQALENEVKASKNAMQMWQKEADSIYQKYQQALSSGNQENADMYYNAYKEALSAANEAENKFYQQSAAWANALRALMENTLAGLAQDLENALTGGTSFDTITTQMKRASSLQEEYLTTTNKIYETTKLMRTAQQEIDKTTNSVAKQKLSQFITETKQMQNQNKLSKYELSIQQAKYDLLVAEIALEEARFAKSTVRLRRDSEGNFGYIYTADAEAISTAEQKFEDAQNKLYNIGLDGANEYTEKYQQTLAEMYDTLTSLQTKYLQGGFESEAEYNAAVLEAKEYYYEKLNQYSELYSVAINAESGTLTDTLVNNSGIVTDALTKNSRIAADAWSTDFADMTTKTDQWMVAVTDYLSQVQNAFADWEVESQRIANETVGTDLTTLKNKVSDIVTESDNLTAAIGDENSGVIKAIYDEITAVSGLVDQYANLNGQLTQAIQNALDLSDALQQDIDQAGQDENPPGQYAPGEEESQKPGTVVPEGTDPLPEIELPEDPDENNPTNPGETTPTEPGETTPTEPGETTPEGTTECTHAETTTQEVAPKCEKGGYKKVLCDSCNKMLENVTYPALGHDYKEGKCTRCGKEDPNWKKSKDVLNNKVEGVAAAIWMDGSDVSGWGTGNTRKSRLKEKGVSEAQDYINKHAENGDIYAAWHNKRSQLKQYYYGKFDTGGYTGAWGPEGKWAMLHEKEIVLNKEDTKNFLASLELLDNILSTIDLHAMNSQWTPYLASPGISNIGKEALEQMVTIEANFPNATDKYEIEEAFKDLVNLASQYANRK